MTKAMTYSQRVAQAKKWRVPLRIYPGAATRGRGPMGDVYAYLVHHTGSDSQSDSYLEFLAVTGRGDLPAPLCNTSTDMDGDVWFIAALRANHAGAGSSRTRAAVLAGKYTGRLTPGPDDLGGTACNGMLYGNEVRFDGGQPMTRAQWIGTVLDAASVCDFHGWDEHHVIGHKEHTGRKPDPGSTDMAALRADVRAALKAGPGNWPVAASGDQPGKVDDMSAKDVHDGVAQYAKEFYTPGATGAEIWADQREAAAKQLAATQDQTAAIREQTAAFKSLATSIAALAAKP